MSHIQILRLFNAMYDKYFIRYKFSLIFPICFLLLSINTLSMASNGEKQDNQAKWEMFLEIDVNNISVKQFISELNKSVGSHIEVEEGVNVIFSMSGKYQAITLLNDMMKSTSTKLINKNGKYVIINDPDKKIISNKIPNETNAENVIVNDKNKETIATNTTNEINDKRIIGTVIIRNKFEKSQGIVWQIVTTNQNVTGYHAFVELDSGNISGAYDEIDKGVYNQSTGYITVKHYWYYYPAIRQDLKTTEDTFKISGNDVFNGSGSKIGIFFNNKFLIKKDQEIPEGNGCVELWGDQMKMVFYTKKSEFFREYPYSKYIKFFCSEADAIQAGYKESLL